MTLKQCIVFDIDGTLADCSHRVHFVNGSRKDWVSFMKGIPDDKPVAQLTMLNAILKDVNYPIFLCSGRSEDERDVTEAWLKKHRIIFDKMYMRKSKDYRADYVIKRELLDEIRADGYEPFIIFDDRQCVVDMWRKEGLFVLQCDPKANFTDHVGFQFHESIKWPLTILVGPSGAGKSRWAMGCCLDSAGAYISSDEIRQDLCGDFKDQSKNNQVFEAMHTLAQERLRRGLPVVIDATNLKNKDRLAFAKLVPERVPIRYIVLNRSVEEKKKSGGWRNAVSVKGMPLIERHEQVFNSNLKDILKGDGLPNVTVFDMRVKAYA